MEYRFLSCLASSKNPSLSSHNWSCTEELLSSSQIRDSTGLWHPTWGWSQYFLGLLFWRAVAKEKKKGGRLGSQRNEKKMCSSSWTRNQTTTFQSVLVTIIVRVVKWIFLILIFIKNIFFLIRNPSEKNISLQKFPYF